MIERVKLDLAESHIQSFLAAMLRLGYDKEEIVSLLRQETGKEETLDGGSGM